MDQEDIIIFASCIGGIFGFLLLCAVVGFLWEHCKFFKSNKTSSKHKNRYLNNLTYAQLEKPLPIPKVNDNCSNHYPTWLYDTMVDERAKSMEEYLANGAAASETKLNSHDPEHYINEVFSDIFDENAAIKKANKVLSYEPTHKLVTPQKKPVPILYYRNEKKKENEEKDKEHLKISLDVEQMEPHKEEVKGGMILPLEDLDLDLFEYEEHDKDPTRIALPKEEMAMGDRIKARSKNQTVEYENPKVMERERKVKDMEELEKEERRRKKIILEQATSQFVLTKPGSEPAKPKIRIPAEAPSKFPSMKTNVAQDSFLY